MHRREKSHVNYFCIIPFSEIVNSGKPLPRAGYKIKNA